MRGIGFPVPRIFGCLLSINPRDFRFSPREILEFQSDEFLILTNLFLSGSVNLFTICFPPLQGWKKFHQLHPGFLFG